MVQEKPFASTFEHHALDLLVALDRRHDFPKFQNKLRAHEIERRAVEYHPPAPRRLSIQPYLCLLRHCVHQIPVCGRVSNVPKHSIRSPIVAIRRWYQQCRFDGAQSPQDVARALGPDEWLGFFVGRLGPPARRARDDLDLCLIASTPTNAETGFTASGECSRIRDARPQPKEPRMSATVLSTFSRGFRRVAAGLAASLALGVLSAHAQAQPTPFPADFRSSQVVIADATINVRVGGHGPAVVLIHGFGATGDMWSPMAAALAKDHTVVVPDLRGMGLSSHPAGGYDKWTQAGDIRAVLDKLGIDGADIVGHDIGVMVAYAYAARYPDKTSRLVVIDSPIPGIPPWNQIVRLPALWHFNFGGLDAERLVAGRERIYLYRFWNEFAGDPSKIDEATRRHYAAIYARPGAMHSAFGQFLWIHQKDEAYNLKAMQTKLTMPVLAIGTEKASGAHMAAVSLNSARNQQ